jgi:hypothetical protein
MPVMGLNDEIYLAESVYSPSSESVFLDVFREDPSFCAGNDSRADALARERVRYARSSMMLGSLYSGPPVAASFLRAAVTAEMPTPCHRVQDALTERGLSR